MENRDEKEKDTKNETEKPTKTETVKPTMDKSEKLTKDETVKPVKDETKKETKDKIEKPTKDNMEKPTKDKAEKPAKGETEKPTKEETKVDGTEGYPEPSNQDYLSYYVYQGEWKPTVPLRPISALSSSPGPAIVNLPPTIGEEGHDITKAKAPGYKMGLKLKQKAASAIGPGPANYDTRNVTNMGKENCRAPKIGRANRFREKLEGLSPGPAAYSREGGDKYIYGSAPSYSMSRAQRGKQQNVNTPGPNSYILPTTFGPGKTPVVKGPAYSMGKAKRDGFGAKAEGPGPAQYMLPSTDVFMNKAPAFHMGSKAVPPSSMSMSPGPGAYKVQLVKFDKNSGPRITFGIRHSPFKAMPGFAAEK